LTPIIGEFRGGVAFVVALVWLLLIAGVVGPAITSGAVVRDRANGRMDRLLTDAGRADVVAIGKLIASLIPLVFILLTIAPSLSFAWLIGGLPIDQAAAATAVVLSSVLLIAAIGLLCASVARTEVIAMVAASLAVGLFLFGPLLASEGLSLAGKRAAANALVAVDPLVALLTTQPQLADKLSKLVAADVPTPQLTVAIRQATLPFWAVDAIAFVVLSLILVWLTSVAIDPLHPLKTWRLRQSRFARQSS
jgi:ABC-type transport system involved in multi-copper enzyme maturation permease subunit